MKLTFAILFALPIFSFAQSLTPIDQNKKCPEIEIFTYENLLSLKVQDTEYYLTYEGHRRFYDSNIWTWAGENFKVVKDDFCSLGDGNYGICWKIYSIQENFISCSYNNY